MAAPTQADLVSLWNELGPNGQKVLHAVATRLALGHRQYGDFPARSWTKEAAEEALDQVVYLTAELLFAVKPGQATPEPAPTSPETPAG